MRRVILAAMMIGGLSALTLGVSLGQEAEKKTEAKSGEGLMEDGAKNDAVRVLKPKLNGIFSLIPDRTLKGVDGKERQLYDFGKEKPLLIITTNANCPMCKKLAPKIVRITKDYADKVDVILVNPNDSDVKEVAAVIKTYGFDQPYFLDEFAEFSTALGTKTTTEVFLLDQARRLRYRGAIDDQYGIGIDLAEAKNHYLKNAIDQLLAAKPIEVEATWAPGCVLDLDKPIVEREDAPTWFGDVEPIIQANCQSCHRPGEGGPFELLTYDDAKSNAAMIRQVVRQRRMPPWFANPHVGGPFKNEARLSDAERQTIIDWVDAGAKSGDAKKKAKALEWQDGWTIEKPDLEIKAGETFTVKAEGAIPYRNVWVKTKEDGDRWVSAYEIRASEPVVVHHVLVFIKYPNRHPRKSEEPKAFDGLTGAFAGMVPGQKAVTFPAGMGKYLPKGAQLRFQIHYTAIGVKTDVDITLGLKFTDGEPEREIRTGALFNVLIAIPPGARNHAVGAFERTQKPMRIIGLLPHMHVRGSAFEYRAEYPEGKEEILLDIPQYDFNWQLAYHFSEHKYIPQGTRLTAKGWYDNSTSNPANPDPKATVRFGEQTWDEMMIGYYDYYYVRDEKDIPGAKKEEPKAKDPEPKGDTKE
ncbi:MAG: redoxin family protein [Planctomycetes bacterium]|nr:redoxin family protein [Planctomycetota bacterium]